MSNALWVWGLSSILVVVLIGSLVTLDRTVGRVRSSHSHLDEAHHGYYGALILFGILITLCAPAWLVVTVALAAILMLGDDALQHLGQCLWTTTFRSPLWRLWRFILTRIL